jgi:putative ubiquitin-RnfH superfamily antitoxin RatB of RatAB toxin-antitoxin module
MKIVEVIFATPDEQICREVLLAKPVSIQEAIGLAQLNNFPDDMSVGVWGKIVPLDFQLQGGERVEIYRPTRISSMEVRRLKAVKKCVGPSGRKS